MTRSDSLYSCSAGTAREHLEQATNARWFHHDFQLDRYCVGDGDRGELAAERLQREVVWPHVEPRLPLLTGDRVFSIGSCFARNIEGALEGAGFDVLSHRLYHRAVEAHDLPWRASGGNNKYNTGSILNELRWALEPGEAFPEAGIVETDDGRYGDVHAHSHAVGSWEEVRAAHRLFVEDIFARLADADALILTLGLVEAWRDLETGHLINTTPTTGQLRRHPDRFRFEVMSYDQNLENLEEIHRLLAAHGKPDLKIYVTVSPVPLAATFTGEDIILANTYSKSVLRAAVEAWRRAHANVEYIPTYEIVTHADPKVAWDPDRAHVATGIVQRIVPWFLGRWLRGVDRGTLEGKVARQNAEDWRFEVCRRLRERDLLTGGLEAEVRSRSTRIGERIDEGVRERARFIEEALQAVTA